MDYQHDYQTGHPTLCNLQIQCNPTKNSNEIIQSNGTNSAEIPMEHKDSSQSYPDRKGEWWYPLLDLKIKGYTD